MRSLSKQYRILCFSRWENVTTARTQYIAALQDHHTDFQVQTTGLIINTSLPDSQMELLPVLATIEVCLR